MTKPPFQLAVDKQILTELIHKANNQKNYDAVADEILWPREMKQQNAMDPWVKQITGYDAHFTVELKSGLNIEIEG